MGRSRYRILDEYYPYFITSSVVNGYHIFRDEECRMIVIESLNFLSKTRGIKIYAYVIMPNHIHIIVQGQELGKYIARLKSFTARKILDLFFERGRSDLLVKFREAKKDFKKDRDHQFWTEGFHPKQISCMEMMRQKISYIHYNPVKAGLVRSEEDWIYSSYRDYYGVSTGLVRIQLYQP